MSQPLCTTMVCAADVRKGYKGCFADNDGPYDVPPYGGRHTLPACMDTNRLTHEQCALAAAQAGYEVYAMQWYGNCCMGTLADVVQMKTQLDESRCPTVPCYNGVGCIPEVHKVYTLGAFCGCPVTHAWPQTLFAASIFKFLRQLARM